MQRPAVARRRWYTRPHVTGVTNEVRGTEKVAHGPREGRWDCRRSFRTERNVSRYASLGSHGVRHHVGLLH